MDKVPDLKKVFDSEKYLRDVTNNGVKIDFNSVEDLEKLFSVDEYILAYFPANRKANNAE